MAEPTVDQPLFAVRRSQCGLARFVGGGSRRSLQLFCHRGTDGNSNSSDTRLVGCVGVCIVDVAVGRNDQSDTDASIGTVDRVLVCRSRCGGVSGLPDAIGVGATGNNRSSVWIVHDESRSRKRREMDVMERVDDFGRREICDQGWGIRGGVLGGVVCDTEGFAGGDECRKPIAGEFGGVIGENRTDEPVAVDRQQTNSVVPRLVQREELLDVGISKQWMLQQSHRRLLGRRNKPGGCQPGEVEVREATLDCGFGPRACRFAGASEQPSDEVGSRQRPTVLQQCVQDCALSMVAESGETLT